MIKDLSILEKKLEYRFKDKSLLVKALTHSSFDNFENNQMLEYLGDSLLDFIVAEYLYKKGIPSEGEATQKRAAKVSRDALAKVFDFLALQDYLIVQNLSLKSLTSKFKGDQVEAVIGAMYLDGGLEVTREFIFDRICLDDAVMAKPDYKSALKELCEKRGLELCYEYKCDGVQNNLTHIVNVLVNGVLLGIGRGKRKIEGEQIASEKALKQLQDRG